MPTEFVPIRKSDQCVGSHHFYVAEVVGCESEGKVFVLLVCTSCGEFRSNEVDLKAKGSIRLLLEEKQKGK